MTYSIFQGYKSNIDRHMKTCKIKIETNQCDICMKEFSNTRSLKDHKSRVHERLAEVKCRLSKVKKTFLKESNLKRHMKRCHGVLTAVFSDDIMEEETFSHRY